MLNEASLTFMLSIGHRSGLLDKLRHINRPATKREIADEAGLDERYVREWLGTLGTGRLIEYAPSTRCYQLPAEHAAWLTLQATIGPVDRVLNDPHAILAGIHRALKDDGLLLAQDIRSSSCLENNLNHPVAQRVIDDNPNLAKSAPTLESLAEAAGLPRETRVEPVRRYNAMVASSYPLTNRWRITEYAQLTTESR